MLTTIMELTAPPANPVTFDEIRLPTGKVIIRPWDEPVARLRAAGFPISPAAIERPGHMRTYIQEALEKVGATRWSHVKHLSGEEEFEWQ